MVQGLVLNSCAGSALAKAAAALRAAGVETPRLDAELLLCHVLGTHRTTLMAHPELALPPEGLADFETLILRRVTREPLPYLLGQRPFLEFDLEVGPGVLIPRSETELLVEVAADRLREYRGSRIDQKCLVVDVGTGSGAIAIGLATRRRAARVIAIDLSSEALGIASRNIKRLEMSSRITLLQGNLLDPVDTAFMGKVDMIVSNPPYIPTADLERLQAEVSRYEPRLALDGGWDGLEIIRQLIQDSRSWLANGGVLAFEVGAGQASSALELLEQAGYASAQAGCDLAGIDRVVMATWQGIDR